MNKQELCERWVSIIRSKGIEYEAEQRRRGEGEKVSNPDLLDIANEIEAFFTGALN